MSLDAVKRVMEVEKQASQQREEGEREARRRITAAEKAGAERLESACRAAEIKVKKMYQAIHQLNDVDKALIMMYLDDKDYSEISRILGITEGNARVKMNRARNKLKQLIKNR